MLQMLLRTLYAIAQEYKIRQAIRSARCLDPRMLTDIGLRESSIESAVRHGRKHLERTSSAGLRIKSQGEALAYAQSWARAWNAKDFQLIGAHLASAAVFISPLAANFGGPVLQGRDRIMAYWRAALDRIGEVQFHVLNATWDPKRSELAIHYIARFGGESRRACELMSFDEAGLQVRGEAFYGATFIDDHAHHGLSKDQAPWFWTQDGSASTRGSSMGFFAGLSPLSIRRGALPKIG